MADGKVVIKIDGDSSGFKTAINGVNTLATKSLSAFNKFSLTTAKGVATAIGAVSTAISGGIVLGNAYNAQIERYATSFEVMTGSAEKAVSIVDKLKKIGASTPFELTDLADTTQLLMNYGFTADSAIDKMMMLGDISQGSAEKMSRIATAYGKMSSAGKVSLEDIKQMIEAGFNPLQEISESTGESMDSLYSRISKGTISVDEITASMERSTSVGGKYFESMEKQSQTFDGLISTLKDNAQQLLGEVVQPITDELTNRLLPATIGIVEELTNAFETGGFEGLSTALGETLSEALLLAIENLPNLFEMAGNLILGFADGFLQNKDLLVQNLTTTLYSLVDVFTSLIPLLGDLSELIAPVIAQAVLKGLPLIWNLGLTILTSLATGISQNAAALVPIVQEAITGILLDFSQNLPLLLNAALEIVLALGQGILAALPTLFELISPLILNLIEFLTTGIPLLLELGLELIKALCEGILEALPEIAKVLPQIWEKMAEFGSETLPLILDLGIQIMLSLIDGLVETLPELEEAFPEILDTAIEAIEKYFPIFLDSGIEILTALIDGLADKTPELLSAVFSLISLTSQKIIDSLPKFIESGQKILSGLITGIGEKLPDLAKKVPEIISTVWDTLKNVNWGNLGNSIVRGLMGGFLNMGSYIYNTVVRFGNSVMGSIKSFFGIASPAKKMKPFGKFISQGVGVGIEDGTDDVIKDVDKQSQAIENEYKKQLAFATGDISVNPVSGINSMSDIKSTATVTNTNQTFKQVGDITIKADVNMDGQKVGELSAPTVNTEMAKFENYESVGAF